MSSDELFHSQEEEGRDHMRYIDTGKRATVGLPEAARIIGISRSTAWELHKQGRFPVPVFSVGNKLLVSKVHLRQFLDRGGQDGYPLAS